MTWTITCECGWSVAGEQAEVVAATQEHGRQLHNMDVSEDQAMAMAVPNQR